MSSDFYRIFEERFYASRETIKVLRRQYLSFIEPLRLIYSGDNVFDIGCGRGEWLELMKEAGFQAFGIDLDEGMLQACRELGLLGEQGDAIAFLKRLPDSSQAVVSAFHVVEHISFEQLQQLVQEALRVLKPGGLLIMETPNPENIIVATRNFYLDPTHQRPIPPELLAFLPEYHGFQRTKILRLQESHDIAGKEAPTLSDVLGGASPDYAVIAQKEAPEEITGQFDAVFSKDYGLDLQTLSSRFDAATEARVRGIEQKAAEAEQKAAEAGQKAAEAEQKASDADAFEQQLLAMQASRSWKVTRPLRGLKRLASGDFTVIDQAKTEAKSAVKAVAAPVVRKSKSVLDQNPVLREKVKSMLLRYPQVYQRLKNLHTRDVITSLPEQRLKHQNDTDHSSELEHMTPRARQIYNDLKRAIEQQKHE